MWLEDFHLDGLRLDAADMIFDRGARHLLAVIKEVAEEVGDSRGWPAVVFAESDLNDPRLLYSPELGGFGLDGQWMDDFHHAIHAFFTGERPVVLRRFYGSGTSGRGSLPPVRLRRKV